MTPRATAGQGGVELLHKAPQSNTWSQCCNQGGWVFAQQHKLGFCCNCTVCMRSGWACRCHSIFIPLWSCLHLRHCCSMHCASSAGSSSVGNNCQTSTLLVITQQTLRKDAPKEPLKRTSQPSKASSCPGRPPAALLATCPACHPQNAVWHLSPCRQAGHQWSCRTLQRVMQE